MGFTRDIVTKAMKDEGFRQRLINDARTTIKKECGIDLPEGMTVKVHQNSPSVINVVLPQLELSTEGTLSEEQLEQVAGGLTLSKTTGTCAGILPSPLPLPGGGFSPLPSPTSPIGASTFGAYTGCCS
jgi:hypothetical protein